MARDVTRPRRPLALPSCTFLPIPSMLFLKSCFCVLPQSQLDCPQCELYEERATKQFLEHLLSVLRVMNSNNCHLNQPLGG